MQKAHQAERNARANWYHQMSKVIADKYGIVYMEDLNTQGMTKSAKGTAEQPGRNVKQKAGLNRSILASGWYKLEQCLSYKAHVEKVPAPYTSQTCNKCGSVDKANRKTQSIFKCQQCGHEDNADVKGLLKKYHHAPVEVNCLVQNHHNHPVRLRPTPLHRRGMIRPYQLRYFFNSPVNAALNILAAGNTATGRGDGDISRSVKRQKIVNKAQSLSVQNCI